jgi:hypothetical protein
MTARCATIFTTIGATGLLLSTLGGTTPHYIWNASNSVPIGLYRVQPATALAVTELVAIKPPDLLAAFLGLNGYLPIGVPMLKRVGAARTTGLQKWLKNRRRWHRCRRSSRTRRARAFTSSLARMQNHCRWRCLCHELAVHGIARWSILWAATCIRGDRQGSTRLD